MPADQPDATLDPGFRNEEGSSDQDTEGSTAGPGAADDQAASGDAQDEGQQLPPEEAAALIRKLKGENRGLRNKKSELANKLQKIEDAQKTDAERLSERVTSLEAENSKLKAGRNGANLRQVLQRHGVRGEYAELVAAELERNGLDYDDEGQPVDVESKLPAMRSKYGALFSPINGRGSVDAAAGRAAGSAGDWFSELMR